ncbi:MAG: hypothetical protein PHG13_01945 [Candidatus Pacebacteria bacterium]|jgi:hypothetical protein|nr:hypothetical protein [Candidatus Paceibacterota bacterium]MDD5721743.1 hypothetical protein [Candidatus Paceibacterota bacterium]
MTQKTKPKKSIKTKAKNVLFDIVTIFFELALLCFVLFLLITIGLADMFRALKMPKVAQKIEQFEEWVEKISEKFVLLLEKPLNWLFKD